MTWLLALLLALPLPTAAAEARGHHHEQQIWDGITRTAVPQEGAPGPTYSPSGAPSDQWRRLLVLAGFPPDVVPEALAVMDCESRGDPNAYNARSGASGLFQFILSTWSSFGEGDPFDPGANIQAAFRLWSHGHPRAGAAPNWGHWECQPAQGGGWWIWPF